METTNDLDHDSLVVDTSENDIPEFCFSEPL